MVYLKKITLLVFFCASFFKVNAQEATAIDSIKAALVEAKTMDEKVFLLDNLSRALMSVNLAEADQYGKQLITVAEESRDRKLMVKAYMSNGERCSYRATHLDYSKRSAEYYNTALEIARVNKMEDDIGAAYLQLALLHLTILDNDKALSYINQGFSRISTLKNDSLKVESHNIYGRVYLARNDKILSLRHYLNALRLAEETKNASLMRNCYIYLSDFYKRIDDYDKAIDYFMLAYKKLDEMKERNVPYQRAIDMNAIGTLFSLKKNYDIAIDYYERSIATADSLKFSTLKLPGYISLLNQYLRIDEPQKALEYMSSPQGQDLKKFLQNFGYYYAIEHSYAVIYTELNQFDSARYYFSKALPYYESNVADNIKINFYSQLAHFYKKAGETSKAIEYYIKTKEMGEKNDLLEVIKNASKELDTLYLESGNLANSKLFNSTYYLYKDSIEKVNKEKELAQIEAFDEQQRLEKELKEKEELKRKRHSIQYMAITIGIAILFIIMVMLGFFRVSAGTIRAIGFFAFLLFFEFIFLVFKKSIYGVTAGEPWKDLAFIIALAALLVPLHHWLEHKVIRFLTSHHMLKLRGIFIRKK